MPQTLIIPKILRFFALHEFMFSCIFLWMQFFSNIFFHKGVSSSYVNLDKGVDNSPNIGVFLLLVCVLGIKSINSWFVLWEASHINMFFNLPEIKSELLTYYRVTIVNISESSLGRRKSLKMKNKELFR